MSLGFASLATAEKADLTFGIDHEFLQVATDALGPMIIDAMNSVQAEDIYFDDGYFKNIHINMAPGATKDFSLNFKPENQSISLNIDNFLGQITMDWEMCGLTFICLWGSAMVNLKNSGFHLSGDLDISPVAHKNGKNLPKMHLDNFNAKLTEDDLQITIFNSMNGSIIGLGVDIL